MQKTFSQFFSILLIATIALSVSCKKGDSNGSGKGGKKSAATAYPMETTLTSDEGKTIEVTIIGRSESEVHFVNKANGKHYSLDVNRLSPKDKLKTKKLPLHRPPDPKKMADQKKRSEKLDRYLKFRRGELERLNRSLKEKLIEQEGFANAPGAKQRQMDRDIKSLENDIEKLESEIEFAENGGDI